MKLITVRQRRNKMEHTHSYRPLCLSLYLNYFVHGIGVIILAQNMDALAARWGSIADVAWVISMLGIGRLIVLFVSGKLSDKYGRKPFVLLGMVTYISFFVGILLSPTSLVACIFGILAGVANSFLDAGTIRLSSNPILKVPALLRYS